MADATKPASTVMKLPFNVDTDGVPAASMERQSAKVFKRTQAAAKAEKLARAEAKGKKLTKKQKAELDKKVKQAGKDAADQADCEFEGDQAAAIKEWKQAFIDKAAGMKGYGDFAKKLTADKWVDQVPGQGQDTFADLYGAQREHYNGWRRPLLNGLGTSLVFDPDWQPETSASLIDAAGKAVYPDPDKDPYWVTSYHYDDKLKKWVGYPPGTWAKITGPNGKSVFARALDGNQTLGVDPAGAVDKHQVEASPALWQSMGYHATGTTGIDGLADGTKFTVEVFPGSRGSGALGYLDAKQTQEAGQMIADGKVKSITGPDDLTRAKKASEPEAGDAAKPAAAPAPKDKKTGMLLLEGFPNVFHGRDMRMVGYADAACVHSGGGHVAAGSATVFVGKYPLSRVGDATSDGLAVVSGADEVLVG